MAKSTSHNRKIITTKDGSPSLYVPELDEHYHSIHGAIQESEHVFIKSGWEYFKDKKQCDILEVGFGTGLNAALTFYYALQHKIPVNYLAFEKYPLSKTELKRFNYQQCNSHLKDFYRLFLSIDNQYNNVITLSNIFQIEIRENDFRNIKKDALFDLIYYDAFGPRVQPYLWTPELFKIMYSTLRPGGILVTYCAKGQVRRNMIEAGFLVERLPGPPGKREMLRAIKSV